jgi:hypothetical protein
MLLQHARKRAAEATGVSFVSAAKIKREKKTIILLSNSR